MENNVYVGIDIAKNDHYACVINADGTVAAKSFKVTNDQAGFATLINSVSNLSNLLTKRSRGHFGKDTARDLKTLAKSSVGARNSVLHIQITQTTSQVELIESQLGELDT